MSYLFRPCRQPGCPGLISGKGNRCREHQREYEKQRGSPRQRGYDRRWEKIRLMVLQGQPLCVDPFGEHGERVVEATEVDHITPLRSSGTNMFANLQSLCKSCHSRKTMNDRGGGA